ncbi:unnamed protein product [Hymenolepis diminuta]|uniref:F5/8 type C domain-containing protein n=1 Tax=Hymenolepis diminuta TaxID=6216 RepID=A0A0R3S980_HYMDI|nr:unnamed protein product [Hymenolepis diminuta]
MRRGSPLLSVISTLFLLSNLIQLIPLNVLGDSQNVMRMDRGAPGANYHYDPAYDACEQDDPLGMISGAITDTQISASSYMDEGGWAINSCSPTNARPFLTNGLAWCPKYKSSTEWLQIDLGVRATVSFIDNMRNFY